MARHSVHTRHSREGGKVDSHFKGTSCYLHGSLCRPQGCLNDSCDRMEYRSREGLDSRAGPSPHPSPVHPRQFGVVPPPPVGTHLRFWRSLLPDSIAASTPSPSETPDLNPRRVALTLSRQHARNAGRRKRDQPPSPSHWNLAEPSFPSRLIYSLKYIEGSIELFGFNVTPCAEQVIQRRPDSVLGPRTFHETRALTEQPQRGLIQRYAFTLRQPSDAVGQFVTDAPDRKLVHIAPLISTRRVRYCESSL